jgi:hypothetical protein
MTAIIGDVANLYRGPAGMLKLARDPADNDLISREAAALGWLAAHGDATYLPYIPSLLGTGGYRAPDTGVVRRGNALGALDGFRDLAFVRSRFPAGLDARDVAWIWRRLLVALGFAHRAGIVHGAVLPPHVLIEPEEHGLSLVDWCYATGGPRPGALPAVPAGYRDWYPPEVRCGYVPHPSLDIYLGTKCMLALLCGPRTPGPLLAGGQVPEPLLAGGQVPEPLLAGGQVPEPLAAFAAGCLLVNPRRRPDDAWALLSELDEVLERLYGPRRFRPFPPLC